MATYATTADLVARFDIETIGQLATDDGVRLLRDDILVHPNVEVALVSACGDVDVSLRVGQRYTSAQLVALDTHGTALRRSCAPLLWLACSIDGRVCTKHRRMQFANALTSISTASRRASTCLDSPIHPIHS